MTPPLRRRDQVDELARRACAGGVDTVGSDHCGYTLEQRGDSSDFSASSPGIPGVETLWPVTYTELVVRRGMPLAQAVALVTAHPARIFGLTGKGRIAPRMDADLVLFDPGAEHDLDERELHSGSGYSPWNGERVAGRVVRTISRGVTVHDQGEIVGNPSHGRYLPRTASGAGRAG